MYDRDKVAKALRLLGDRASSERAASEIGVSRATVKNWAARRVPHERASGRIRVRTKTVKVPELDAEEKAAHQAGMEESVLIKAVLDDLKAARSAPATTSRRRCAELG